MPVKLSTTLEKIDKIENIQNRLLIKQYHKFMVSTGASERHQNNNLKAILSYVNYLGKDTFLSNIKRCDSILSFLETKKKAHIKQYFPLHILDKKSPLLSSLTLSKILDMIRLNADVPDDFEEYCELHLKDPSNEAYRSEYLIDLWRAERFKKFITQEEIQSFPFRIDRYDNKQNNEEEEEIETIDLNDEFNLKLLGYSFIFLNVLGQTYLFHQAII